MEDRQKMGRGFVRKGAMRMESTGSVMVNQKGSGKMDVTGKKRRRGIVILNDFDYFIG
jgi:hypothetical protein